MELPKPGWWFFTTPLKNDGVKVSWDDDSPNLWKVIKHVPNHQPETDLNLVLTHFPSRLRLQSRAPAFPPNSCPGPHGGDFKALINHENLPPGEVT